MENEKKTEYLSEERYQQTNVKVKKVGKILLIVGAIALAISLLFTVLGFVGIGDVAKDSVDSVGDHFDFEDGSFDIDGDLFEDNTKDIASGAFGSVGIMIVGSIFGTIGFILLVAGGVIMLVAHKREITAYTVQQTMPLAQEGIEKMAPTVGSAIGTVGKELAKGIKEGINEADNSNDNTNK